MDSASPQPLHGHRSDGSSTQADLAAIVLGHDRRVDAPERVPVDRGDGPGFAFDARSALVLALVVVVIVGGIAWATTTWRSDSRAPLASAGSGSSRSEQAGSTTVADDAATADAAPTAPVLVPGVDLVIGRIGVTRSATGGALVTVNVANRGRVATTSSQGATVLLLVDGEVAATEPLPAIEAGGSTKVDLSLDYCPSGDAAFTAMLDPGAAIAEHDERNNATSRTASIGC